ncbi:MAG: sigma 54-interacting transcriptional regulator [Myxococcaceae bacterium]
MTTPALKISGPSTTSELCLLVIGETNFHSHPLPEQGELVIGSASGCDLVVSDGSVGERHALLTLGPALTITDLGSNRATAVGTQQLPSRETAPLTPGEMFRLGGVMLLVQRRVRSESRRIWTNGYFEMRVEEECLRAERYGRGFTLLRIRVQTDVPSEVLEERLSRMVRSVDIVASYSTHAYQILLCETEGTGADFVATRLKAGLSELGPVSLKTARYQVDGRSADQLLAALGDSLAAPRREAASYGPVPGHSPMGDLRQLVSRVAASTINVLVFGETGVGKEHLASEVHRLSPRARKIFLGINVAALPETLLESELFGHERGAFTGAVAAKAGLIESAEGGTLFLDEVGEMPLSTQVKLLRMLETREVLRVGGTKPKRVDVRLVAATNRDLEAAVAEGGFREDLYFRLNGVSLLVPPLRERVSEIEGLARAFVKEATVKFERGTEAELSLDVIQLLERYHWPGNIRELRNVMERAVVVCDGPMITREHLPVEKLNATFVARKPVQHHLQKRVAAAAPTPPPADDPRQRIIDALAKCSGNQTRAAQQLGVSRRTLVNWMTSYSISGPRKQRA